MTVVLTNSAIMYDYAAVKSEVAVSLYPPNYVSLLTDSVRTFFLLV